MSETPVVKRGRKATPVATLPMVPEIDPQAAAQDQQALQAWAEQQHATQENAVALAATLAYEGALDPDILEAGIQANQQRVQFEMFEAGKRLLLLREQCAHGDFTQRLERLGIAPRAAQKFMQATLKFANAPSTAHLASYGKTKLLELLVLDDDESAALAEGESVRGLTLDDIDCMSVSELRRALRDARVGEEVKGKIIAEKTAKIGELADRLTQKESRVEVTPPDEVLAEIRSELLSHAIGAEAGLTNALKPAFAAYAAHLAATGGVMDDYVAATLDQLERVIAEIRDEFGVHRDGNTPAWAI